MDDKWYPRMLWLLGFALLVLVGFWLRVLYVNPKFGEYGLVNNYRQVVKKIVGNISAYKKKIAGEEGVATWLPTGVIVGEKRGADYYNYRLNVIVKGVNDEKKVVLEDLLGQELEVDLTGGLLRAGKTKIEVLEAVYDQEGREKKTYDLSSLNICDVLCTGEYTQLLWNSEKGLAEWTNADGSFAVDRWEDQPSALLMINRGFCNDKDDPKLLVSCYR